jgi:hypothetical protein
MRKFLEHDLTTLEKCALAGVVLDAEQILALRDRPTEDLPGLYANIVRLYVAKRRSKTLRDGLRHLDTEAWFPAGGEFDIIQ